MQNFEHWGLRPQTPVHLAAGDEAPDPQNSLPRCEFLATRLDVSKQVKIYFIKS